MSEAKVMIERLSQLRSQIKRLPRTGGSAVENDHKLHELERRVHDGFRKDAMLEGALRGGTRLELAAATSPVKLASRARHVLERSLQLVGRLRGLQEGVASCDDPLDAHFREILAVCDLVVRVVRAMPDGVGAQLRLCDGLEPILSASEERTVRLQSIVERRRRDAARLEFLTDLMMNLARESAVEAAGVVELAESLLGETEEGAAIRFLDSGDFQGGLLPAARGIACHGLVTAQVVTRLARLDSELRTRPIEAIVAALLHDVGMLKVPFEAWTHAQPLDEAQRRLVEEHPRRGANLVARLMPNSDWLVDAILCHHERLDGTGYPRGQRDLQIPRLARLLSACDVYAALRQPRPHRPAIDPRRALADTLLLADSGALDRMQAERLLDLSFYPVGTVVELTDGSVARVVATHHDHQSPAKPVVARLTDSAQTALPTRELHDLAACDRLGIERALTTEECRTLLWRANPECCC